MVAISWQLLHVLRVVAPAHCHSLALLLSSFLAFAIYSQLILAVPLALSFLTFFPPVIWFQPLTPLVRPSTSSSQLRVILQCLEIFFTVTTVGLVTLALSGERPWMLLQCTGWPPTTKNYLVQNVNSATAEELFPELHHLGIPSIISILIISFDHDCLSCQLIPSWIPPQTILLPYQGLQSLDPLLFHIPLLTQFKFHSWSL